MHRFSDFDEECVGAMDAVPHPHVCKQIKKLKKAIENLMTNNLLRDKSTRISDFNIGSEIRCRYLAPWVLREFNSAQERRELVHGIHVSTRDHDRA
jgi:hypothetical protein